jgi:hypothetical protein
VLAFVTRYAALLVRRRVIRNRREVLAEVSLNSIRIDDPALALLTEDLTLKPDELPAQIRVLALQRSVLAQKLSNLLKGQHSRFGSANGVLIKLARHAVIIPQAPAFLLVFQR